MAKLFLVPIDLNKLELRQALAHLIAGDPGTPVEGQLWYDSVSKTFQFRTNSASIDLGRLDQISAPTAAVSLNSQKITSLADPTTGTDAATKQYVDSAITGLDWKQSVRVATTANGALATAYENTDVVDGVTLATGDRILLKNQTTGSENGIYTVNASGAPTRATDADVNAEVTTGMTVPVSEGTANADSAWILTTNDPITVGTTSLAFTKLGPTTVSGTAKFAGNVGDGASTSIVVTHSLGTTDVIVMVYDLSSKDVVECDVDITSTTTITLIFAVAPASNAYRVIVVG